MINKFKEIWNSVGYKKIFFIPVVLVLVYVFISFLDYKGIINTFDERFPRVCGDIKELQIYPCESFYEFYTGSPLPIHQFITVIIFILSSIISFLVVCFLNSRKVFYYSVIVLLILLSIALW